MSSMAIPREFRTHDGRIEVGKLKRSVDIVEVARRLTPLRGSGAHLKGLCPFHKERTASFLVDPTRQIWHCFGCGRGGDVIQLLCDAGEPGFHDACRRLFDLAGAFVPSASARCGSAGVPRLDHVALARQAWREANPIESTPGSAYLAARGLEGLVPRSLRFGMVPASWDDGGRPGPLRPAILAAAQDVAGRVVGIQRIFVDPGRRGYPFRPLRLSLGRIRGSALRLGPVRDTVMLTGSVEDGVALQRMFVGATVWCSLGEDNLQNVVFPAGVRKVVLAGDSDEAGRAAVDRARTEHEGRAIEVDTLFPRAGKDFNEELLLLHV